MIHINLTTNPRDQPPISEHQPVEFCYPAVAGATLELRLGGQLLEPFLLPGSPDWHWRWNPGTAVGLHQLMLSSILPGEAAQQHHWQLRVEPRKIDQARYAALLDDVQQSAAGLVAALGGAGAEDATLQRAEAGERGPIEEYYALFEGQLDALERAVRRIAGQPREHLRARVAAVGLGEVTVPDYGDALLPAGSEVDAAPPGVADELQAALRPGGGLLPRTLRARASQPSVDSYEHRLLKRLLTLLQRRARALGAAAEREATRLESLATPAGARLNRTRGIVAGCQAAEQRLRMLANLPFFAEVGPLNAFRGATPLLQRDPAYREIYRAWLGLRRRPYVAVEVAGCTLPIGDLPLLYERWCVLQVVAALLRRGGIVQSQQLLASPPDEDEADRLWEVTLVEDQPLLVLERAGVSYRLRYQPRYTPQKTRRQRSQGFVSLDRHTRMPDLAIEVSRPDAAPTLLALDAKYRLDADGRHVPPDALADGYAYLGAIGVAGQRATLGALLLYPGEGPPELYPSGVGAVPLLPGQSHGLDSMLGVLLALP